MADTAPRDENQIPALLGTSSSDGTPVTIYADPDTHRLLVNTSGSLVGASGSFTTADSKTVTVQNGIITDIS